MTLISLLAYAGIGIGLTNLGLQMRRQKKRWGIPLVGGIVFLFVAAVATLSVLLKAR
jgi:UDP-N-acetylmuramyl pentapeptide phosphotransferase/UDP-N-acetylglucosamine-1-phosphate transferase